MSNLHQCLEGIVLQTLPFQERGQIVTLFTAEHGLLKLYYHSPLPVLQRIEAQVLLKGERLSQLEEMVPRDRYAQIKDEPAVLQDALYLTHTLLRTQQGQKESHDLYALFRAYLLALPRARNSAAVRSSFAVKILLHDGLLSFTDQPSWTVDFTTDEIVTLFALAQSRSLEEINGVVVSESLAFKSNLLLEQLTEQV